MITGIKIMKLSLRVLCLMISIAVYKPKEPPSKATPNSVLSLILERFFTAARLSNAHSKKPAIFMMIIYIAIYSIIITHLQIHAAASPRFLWKIL